MRLLSVENCLEKTFPEAFPKLTISDKKRNILLTLTFGSLHRYGSISGQ